MQGGSPIQGGLRALDTLLSQKGWRDVHALFLDEKQAVFLSTNRGEDLSTNRGEDLPLLWRAGAQAHQMRFNADNAVARALAKEKNRTAAAAAAASAAPTRLRSSVTMRMGTERLPKRALFGWWQGHVSSRTGKNGHHVPVEGNRLRTTRCLPFLHVKHSCDSSQHFGYPAPTQFR